MVPFEFVLKGVYCIQVVGYTKERKESSTKENVKGVQKNLDLWRGGGG